MPNAQLIAPAPARGQHGAEFFHGWFDAAKTNMFRLIWGFFPAWPVCRQPPANRSVWYGVPKAPPATWKGASHEQPNTNNALHRNDTTNPQWREFSKVGTGFLRAGCRQDCRRKPSPPGPNGKALIQPRQAYPPWANRACCGADANCGTARLWQWPLLAEPSPI